MPDSKDTLKNLRMQLERRLKTWISDNDALVNQELRIFDSLMSRRSFLKTTSAATLTMMVGQGCGGAPSDSDDVIDSDFENNVISESAKVSVSTPANIAVDADVHSSFVSYNPLPAFHSSDSSHVKDHAVMESFNPHIMTTDAADDLARLGFVPPERTYGIPEHVHLSKDRDNSDYYLAVYEKSHAAQHGLSKSTIPLSGTANMEFNSLTATNGTFHNKVSGNTTYSQKLALLANTRNVGVSISDTKQMRLYYQTGSSELLEPNIGPSDAGSWKYIDVIDEFKSSERGVFWKYSILDVDVYHDGHHNSFIYGTLSFDTYYYYGFVITFNSITDSKPSITFFTPEFLSYKSDTIGNLKSSFDNIKDNYGTDYDFDQLSIFQARNFQPLAQGLRSDGTSDSKIYFTFATMNVSDSDVSIESDNGSFYIEELTDNTYLSRYFVPVDTTKKIDYLLRGHEPATAEFSVDSDDLSFVFDNSNIPSLDIWEKVYDKDETLIYENFVRSIQSVGSSLEVILASPYYNQDSAEMGLVHKLVSIQNGSASVETSHTLLEDGAFINESHTEQDYKALWHDDMKSHLGRYNSIYETVFKNNGMQSVQFHCTHNHQGLLRSYYIISNNTNSLLLGFNEKGMESEDTLAYQNHDNLKSQIQQNSAAHYPPMPIAINPKYLHKWHGMVEDSEVLFTSMSRHKINQADKKLVENDDASLLSYMHSSCNLTQKNWNTHENKIHIDADADTNLVSADLHQVHLHVTNIYRHPVSLHKSKNFSEEVNNNIFVEVRFNKRLNITDHTDPNSPKTYHPGANSSLFLSTDKAGRISLEVDTGSKNDKYNGAEMQYRLVDKSEIQQKADTPLATVTSSTGGSTIFKKCNISFKMYQRLSVNNYDKPETGVKRPGGKTVKDGLGAAISYSGAISKIADGYGKLSQASHVSPDNSAALVSLGESLLWLGSFGPSITHFHPASYLRHAADTALSTAESAIQSAKQAVNKLAHSIDDAIANIENDVVTAVEDIAAAVEKLWDEAVSLADKLWDYLMALLDLDTAYDVGQELKQLRYDQLKPISDSSSKNSNSKNIYTVLENTENLAIQITDNVKSRATNLINEIYDSDIFQIQELADKLNSHRGSANKDHHTQQNNSTKITHIMDQFSRLKKMLHIGMLETYAKEAESQLKNDLNTMMEDIFGISLSDMFSGSFPEYLKVSVLNFFKVDTEEQLLAAIRYYPGISSGEDPAPDSLIRKIQNNATEMKDHMQTFAGGSTDALDIAAQVEKNFKNSALLAVDQIDEILDAAIKMPSEFLKDDKILQFMTSSGPDLEKLLKPLGLLLFMDESKFKNFEDTAAFAAGFAINIAPLMAESTYNEVSGIYSKNAGATLDLSSMIAEGTLRNNLNNFLDLAHKIITKLSTKVITADNLKSVASEIAGLMEGFADKILFKVTNLVIDFVGLIFTALEKITSLINKIPPIKDPIFDALAAVFHVYTGIVQMSKIQPAIIEIGFKIFEYVKNRKGSIENIVLMAIQAVIDTIKYILELVVKICEASKAVGKGQPGEVILNDPLRIALISIAGFIVAGLGAFVVDVASAAFKFASMGHDLYSSGLSHLLKDALVGVTVVLELAALFFSFTHLMSFLFTEILGYVVKSIDIELIIAGFETVALPIVYAAAWVLYLASLGVETVLSGIKSVSTLAIDAAQFAESEA